MAIDRHSIIEATELMGSAASTIKSIMRAGSLSDIHNAQRMQVNSGCSALEDGCPELAAAVNDAALFLHDFWTEIEVNKALLLETESFLRRYQSFKAAVVDFDNWRQDCYNGVDFFPAAHQIAMSLVRLCASADREIQPVVGLVEELRCGGKKQKPIEERFEDDMKVFCTIPYSGYLAKQVVRAEEMVVKSIWRGQKNELSYFAKWFGKDSFEIRRIFELEEEKKTKQPFEISKYDPSTLSGDNALIQTLKKYPREDFLK